MRGVFLCALLAVPLLHAGSAGAYCLTTTCDTQRNGCTTDENGCSDSGIPLSWPNLCLSFGVQEEGSALRRLEAGLVEGLMEQAFDAWMQADCGEGTPPFVVQSIGQVECQSAEFNCDPGDTNANIVMFRDSGWEHDHAALAITTVTVDTRNGEILDADMEVNTDDFNFSTGDVNVNNDLLSVLTHEAGHFLGLSHSPVIGATMFAGYSSRDTTIRSLDPDDMAGICELYPSSSGSVACELDIPRDTQCLGGSECPDQVVEERRSRGCSITHLPTGSSRGSGLLSISTLLGISALLGGLLVFRRALSR